MARFAAPLIPLGYGKFVRADRVFALVPLDGEPATVNLKCDPDLALELRERHVAVQPGYHQNKRHWNTVTLDASLPDRTVRDMIEDSYDLVVASLPRASRPAAG